MLSLTSLAAAAHLASLDFLLQLPQLRIIRPISAMGRGTRHGGTTAAHAAHGAQPLMQHSDFQPTEELLGACLQHMPQLRTLRILALTQVMSLSFLASHTITPCFSSNQTMRAGRQASRCTRSCVETMSEGVLCQQRTNNVIWKKNEKDMRSRTSRLQRRAVHRVEQ
jgi:hypothetical protein